MGFQFATSVCTFVLVCDVCGVCLRIGFQVYNGCGWVWGWDPGRLGSGLCLGLLSLLRFLMMGSLLTTPPHNPF